MLSSHPPRLLLAGLLSLGVSACAVGPSVQPAPSPEEIPALEARLARANDDVDAGLRLAAAYRAVERHDDAVALVARLSALDARINLGSEHR